MFGESTFYDTQENFLFLSHLLKRNKKGKATPLQAWTCPEGSRRLRLPYVPAAFTPQEIFLILISVRG
jgi:hypothetical protein